MSNILKTKGTQHFQTAFSAFFNNQFGYITCKNCGNTYNDDSAFCTRRGRVN